MQTLTYQRRRSELETYFDRTAVEAWSRLTSDAPLGRIRATVRAGRERMRETLLSWLPGDLTGKRILDAGCGTGALATEVARRGAQVIAIDLSKKLVDLAAQRSPTDLGAGSLDFRVGDMLDPELGAFDHVVAMDSLIHYGASDMVAAIESLTALSSSSLLFTFAPRTPALTVMHLAGRMIPHREHRAPAIQPVAESTLRGLVACSADLDRWQVTCSKRITSGFYTSQAMELVKT